MDRRTDKIRIEEHIAGLVERAGDSGMSEVERGVDDIFYGGEGGEEKRREEEGNSIEAEGRVADGTTS